MTSPRTPRQWPETPEPPREDEVRTWRQGDPEPGIDVTAVRHSNSQTFIRLVVTTEHAGFPLSTYSYWRAGIGNRLSWEELTGRLHGHTLTEVNPASQSGPAVPVSSPPIEDIGEAAETAAEALSIRPVGPRPSREELGHRIREVWVRWAREQADPKSSWLLPWEDLDDGQREVDMRMGEALFGLGMVWSPVPSPLPDSETEWGCRDRHGRVHSVGVENEAQARSMRSMTPVRREVGPWIEVTS
jgi:hypothetical protein